MSETNPAADPRKLRQAAVMAAEILDSLCEALRRDFAAGRLAAFEAAKGFLEGPCGGWVARAVAALRDSGLAEGELDSRLRAAYLDLERGARAVARLFEEEKRCRRDEVCAAAALAPTQGHAANLKDLRELLRSLKPSLGEPGLQQLLELADAPEPAEDARCAHPAVRLASLILLDAGRRGASDVLAVPGPWCSLVQYRLGGILAPILELPLSYHRALVTRFKLMAGMDLSLRKRPQDGPAVPAGKGPPSLEGGRSPLPEGAAGDEGSPRAMVRVLPTVHGERLDIHLEGPPKAILHPRELGLPKGDLDRYEALLAARAGLVIHAGLSGTGKRTALLAGLAVLARQGRNAFAILSRHSYDVPGASVSLAATGAQDHAALMNSVRQRGPDAIAVDDLGAPEAMREALQAAVQGALVLGALPCDGAVAALRRLFDMGLAADLVRQVLLGICGHRLPRRLCACRQACAPRAEELALLAAGGERAELKLCRPVGCPACLNTGFRGVAPVFEMLVVGERLRPLLKPGATDQDWLRAAEADGMTPFKEGLKTLVLDGATSLAEARRLGLCG